MSVTNITKNNNFLLEIIPNLPTKKFAKGAVIFLHGQKATYSYIVKVGQAKIYRTTPDGKDHTIHIMQQDDIIGEVPMFEGGTYPASCMAITDLELVLISRTQILTLIRNKPDAALQMLALQAKRLREFTQKVEQLQSQNLEQRLLEFLGQKNRPENLSVQDIADYLGATRENVSRIISKLSRLKLITKKQRSITLARL